VPLVAVGQITNCEDGNTPGSVCYRDGSDGYVHDIDGRHSKTCHTAMVGPCAPPSSGNGNRNGGPPAGPRNCPTVPAKPRTYISAAPGPWHDSGEPFGVSLVGMADNFFASKSGTAVLNIAAAASCLIPAVDAITCLGITGLAVLVNVPHNFNEAIDPETGQFDGGKFAALEAFDGTMFIGGFLSAGAGGFIVPAGDRTMDMFLRAHGFGVAGGTTAMVTWLPSDSDDTKE
jgi:hypothetical protein